MKTVTVRLTGISPYSPSRPYEIGIPRDGKETPADYEKRTWRERCHRSPEGFVMIPPMAIKNGLDRSASFLGMKFKGQRTYGPLFASGVLVVEPIILGVKVDDVSGEWLYLNSDGKKGGGKRVWKCEPYVMPWEGDAQIVILNESINADIMRAHLEAFGQYVGLGRFRPDKGGFYGRFSVGKMTME